MAANVRGIMSPQEYRQPGLRVLYVIFIAMALLLTLIMFYPIFWVFTGSLKNASEIYAVPPTVLPTTWHWENFAAAWEQYDFPHMMLNTLLIYLGFFLSKMIVITTAAYALSRLKLPFRKFFYLLFLGTLMMPAIAYLVPSYLVIQHVPIFGINLLDSWWALWIPAGADSFALLMMKGFFDDIPRELSEASRIDGCSELGILTRIILPLSRPIIAVLGIFAFLGIWNDFFWQKMVLITPQNWTIAVMLWFRSTIGSTPPINMQLAAMFMSLIPPMILFLFFQKNITQGITTSGLKG